MSITAARQLGTTGDEVVDACIVYSKALTTDVYQLYIDVYNGNVETSEDLRDRYAKLRERILIVTHKLKPAAIERYSNMYHDEGAPLKNALEAATGQLKQRHKTLLSTILERVHDNEYDFPLDPPPPDCFCSRIKSPIVRNAGWIVTGGSVSFALLTLTPLGEQLGPYLARVPKYFGDTVGSVGAFFTKVFQSEPFLNAATSPWMGTLGKLSILPAVAYPAYWFAKEPVTKVLKKVDEKFTDIAIYSSENPMKTFLIAWSTYYAALWVLGLELKFLEKHDISPIHARLALTCGGALVTPPGLAIAYKAIDDYKQKAARFIPPAEVPKKVAAETQTNPTDTAKKNQALLPPSPPQNPVLTPPLSKEELARKRIEHMQKAGTISKEVAETNLPPKPVLPIPIKVPDRQDVRIFQDDDDFSGKLW